MLDWLFRRAAPAEPARPFLRFGLTLLEARRTGTVEPAAMPFEAGIRTRTRGSAGDRSWEHLVGWTGLRVVSSATADLGRSQTHTFSLAEGHRITVAFEEVTAAGILRLSVDLHTRSKHRASGACRSRPGTEYYRVLDWSDSERALVLVERHDLEA